MTSAGPLYAGTGANSNDGGTTAWSNPSNATGDTTSTAATCNITSNGGTSQLLRVSNFGFSIPAGSIIVGVTAEIERAAADNSRHRFHAIKLLVGGSEAGYAKGVNDAITTTKSFSTYGSSSDLWNVSLLPAQVNASTFGLSIKINRNSTSSTTTSIYRVRLTVTYSDPVAGVLNVVGTAQGGSTGAGSATITPPAGATSYLAVVTAVTAGGVFTPASNWTKIFTETTISTDDFWTVWQAGSDAGDFWETSNSQGMAISIVGFDDDIASITQYNTTSASSPSGTATGPCLAFRWVGGAPGDETGVVFTYPTSATMGRTQYSVPVVGDGYCQINAIASEQIASAGSVASATWAWTGTGSTLGDDEPAGTYLLYAPVHTTVTPDAASLTLTGYAPTVTATAHKTVTPDAASLTLTGYAPTVTVSDNIVATPSAASLTLTGYAPTVTTTANVTVTPGAASVTLTGYAPTVTATANVVATPDAASLTLTGYAPTVTATANATVTPDAAALTLTTYAPTVTATGNVTVTPPPASLTLTGYSPTVTVSGNVVVTPDAASLTLTGYAPTVTATANVTATPGPASLTLTGYAPTVTATANVEVTPAAAALTLTTYAPTVTATANVVVTPDAATLTLTGYVPTVTTTGLSIHDLTFRAVPLLVRFTAEAIPARFHSVPVLERWDTTALTHRFRTVALSPHYTTEEP